MWSSGRDSTSRHSVRMAGETYNRPLAAPSTLPLGNPFSRRHLYLALRKQELQASYFRLAISPVQNTSVSSFENRSFSRMTVFPSSSSSDLSRSLSCLFPRIEHRNTDARDVLRVARDECQVMLKGSRRKKPINYREQNLLGARLCGQVAPPIRHLRINW